jgi:chorismate mutase
MVPKSEREMKEMMKSVGKYVMKKKLQVDVEKREMMVFNKRKRKSEDNEWNWDGRKIERAKEFK